MEPPIIHMADKGEWWIAERGYGFLNGNPLTNGKALVKQNPYAPAAKQQTS